MTGRPSGKTYVVRFSGILSPDGGMERVVQAAQRWGYVVEYIDRVYRFEIPAIFKTSPDTPIHKMYPKITLRVVLEHFADNLSGALGRPFEGTISQIVDEINATEVRQRGVRVHPRPEGADVTPINFVVIDGARGKSEGRITIVREGTVEDTFYITDSDPLKFQETSITTLTQTGRYSSGIEKIPIRRRISTKLIRIYPDVIEVNRGSYLTFEKEVSVDISSSDKRAARNAMLDIEDFVKSIPGVKTIEAGIFKLDKRFGGTIGSRSRSSCCMTPCGVLMVIGGIIAIAAGRWHGVFLALALLVTGTIILGTEFLKSVEAKRKRKRAQEWTESRAHEQE